MLHLRRVYDLAGVSELHEQSYVPTMSEGIHTDTVCHEHLEYYGLNRDVHYSHAGRPSRVYKV